jgi:hypothetical protein
MQGIYGVPVPVYKLFFDTYGYDIPGYEMVQ